MIRSIGIEWILRTNLLLGVQQVFSDIKPKQLRDRLESDLSFYWQHMSKRFNAFMDQALKVSEAFQILHTGVRQRDTWEKLGRRGVEIIVEVALEVVVLEMTLENSVHWTGLAKICPIVELRYVYERRRRGGMAKSM